MPFNAIIICTKINVFVRYYSFVTISKRGGRKGSRHFEFWKVLQMFVYGFEEEQFSDPVDVHTYKQQI